MLGIWVSTWVEFLANYHHLKWTYRTLISQAQSRKPQRRKKGQATLNFIQAHGRRQTRVRRPSPQISNSKEFTATRRINKFDSLDFGPDLPTTRQAASRSPETYTYVKENNSAENVYREYEQHTLETSSQYLHCITRIKLQQSMKISEEVESPQHLTMRASRVHTMRGQLQYTNISPLIIPYPKVEENRQHHLAITFF